MSKNDNRDYNGQIDYKAEDTVSYQMYPNQNTFTAKNEKRGSTFKNFITLIIVVIVIGVVLYFGYNYFTSTPSSQGTDQIIIEAQKSLLYSTSSPNELVDRLEYKEYSNEEIEEAIEELNIDWDKQAIDYAYDKADYKPSEAFVTQSMTDGGFTQSQIDNALEENDFNWNLLALQYSEKKVRESYVSETSLFDNLDINEFTDEQISYVKENMNFDFYRVAEKKATELNFSNDDSNESLTDEEIRNNLITQLVEYGFTQDQAEQAVVNLVI